MGMASNYQCFSDFKREEHKNTATTLCDVSYMGGCIFLGVQQKKIEFCLMEHTIKMTLGNPHFRKPPHVSITTSP